MYSDGTRDGARRAPPANPPHAPSASAEHDLRLAERDPGARGPNHGRAVTGGVAVTAVTPPSAAAMKPRLSRSPLILMLDIDGTLAPLQPRPEDSFVPAETRQAVVALAER